MAEVTDYLQDETGDLIIENGDFKKGDATEYLQKNLLLATKGSYTQSPTTGVGLIDFILDSMDEDEVRHVIQEQFEADGMSVKRFDINRDGQLIIDADYGD